MSALEKDAWRITFSEVKAAAEDIIEEARKGRMFILVDDEDRENEGDLVIPAQWATPVTAVLSCVPGMTWRRSPLGRRSPARGAA